MGVLDNPHLEQVLALVQQTAHVEPAANEGAVNAPHRLMVEIDLRLPVDAVEVEVGMLSVGSLGRGDRGAVPEVGLEETLRNLPHLVGVAVVGDGTDIHVARQHRTRHRGFDPLVVAVAPQLPVVDGAVVICLGHESAAAPHLHLAEHQQPAVVGLVHEQSDVAPPALAADGLVEAVVVGQWGDAAPRACVVGQLHLTAVGFMNPMQTQMVDVGCGAEVDVEPRLLTVGRCR